MDNVKIASELVKLARELMADMFNMRLYSRVTHEKIQTYCAPGNKHCIDRLLRDLEEAQESEPRNQWILETRGMVSDWHEYKP